MDCYDDLLATALTDGARLRRMLESQDCVMLALDGMQPDVGHEVLCKALLGSLNYCPGRMI